MEETECLDGVMLYERFRDEEMPMQSRREKPNLVAVVTAVRPKSHADVILTPLLQGCHIDGVSYEPRLRLTRLYTDQVPENDMSRAMAKQYGFRICETIEETVRGRSDEPPADGVILIGEHGDYPWNEFEQHLYPRWRFFSEALEALDKERRTVPLFNDKFLSWDWHLARRMYAMAEERGIPFFAGSVIPRAWRNPPLTIRPGTPISAALSIGYGPIESYGFHALEALQGMVEHRTGGEIGVRAVHCVRGDAFWEEFRRGTWSHELTHAALTASGSGPEALAEAEDPHAFLVERSDGWRTATLMLAGAADNFAFAGYLGDATLSSTCFPRPAEGYRPLFNFLVREIEEVVLTKTTAVPIKRTLLTTGILHAIMRSRFLGERIETPHLSQIAYQP